MVLPVVSGRKVIKALSKAGFQVVGRRGSHIKLKKKVNGKVSLMVLLSSECLSSTFLFVVLGVGVGLWMLW